MLMNLSQNEFGEKNLYFVKILVNVKSVFLLEIQHIKCQTPRAVPSPLTIFYMRERVAALSALHVSPLRSSLYHGRLTALLSAGRPSVHRTFGLAFHRVRMSKVKNPKGRFLYFFRLADQELAILFC